MNLPNSLLDCGLTKRILDGTETAYQLLNKLITLSHKSEGTSEEAEDLTLYLIRKIWG